METLPDLDQGPEVYETSDVESVDKLYVNQEGPGDDIETPSFDTKNAHNTFEENTLVGLLDLVDFLGSLLADSLGRNSYHTKKWSETKAQRLARIARELEEIEAEEEEERTQVENLRDLLETLVQKQGKDGYYYEQLRALYEQVDLQMTRLNEEETRKSPENNPQDTNPSVSNSASVLDLELRLHSLERVVGIHELSLNANLRMHLRDLDRKVNVLYNPEHEIGAMKDTVESLNKELETLAKSRRMAQLGLPEPNRTLPGHGLEAAAGAAGISPPSIFEKKVDSVFLKLGEIVSTKARLPQVLTRLRSLHETHCDLAGAVATIGDMDNTLGTLQQDLQSWNKSMDTVKMAMGQHAKTFDVKLQAVESALGKMEARVEALEAGNE